MRKIIARIFAGFVEFMLSPLVLYTVRNVNDAPICCGKSMEFVGESLGFSRMGTYQCEKCRKIEMI